ncbi:allophanate hydrolase [Jatrophihabitans sp. GAS493]|uniref:allophanate hydrolase n=1 Tax=Jatrophihabitans sp. GAS493 TaxID=1907575 RepID=UPI000BBFE466|nr:allophanate hydrolase [Jatrophihabitans sp. GAS493]SOD71917.1 allophanate hydrolase [Jatrophihabitans sp. GAS493]
MTLLRPASPLSPAEALAAARRLEEPAFISLASDEQLADFEAAAALASADSPLAGILFAVKDNIDVAGFATTAACPALSTPAGASAFVVDRLIGAGAVPIGKTNMDQFATGLVGTRTPYGACHSVDSVEHISGGSSSGSAIAVAVGLVPLALGTDTAGSGRVPAAFNGLVGMKPSRGLVSATGLLPASPSLDCISTFTRSVADARAAFDVIVAPDPLDPRSRPMPPVAPLGIAKKMQVVGVPSGALDLDDEYRDAWGLAVQDVSRQVDVVPIDVSAFLETARLLYNGPFVAERLSAFGHHLEPDGDHLDPVVRRIVLAARSLTATEVFDGLERLAELSRVALAAFVGVDAVMLPVTPFHPTLAQVAADPIGVNSRLGTYTNMVNLLDLCAIALPGGRLPSGLPFGYQLLAPTFADRPLLDLAARLNGEVVAPSGGHGTGSQDGVAGGGPPAHSALLAVSGAHLSGQPLNSVLIQLGGRLHSRTRTAPGYRMYRVPGRLPRPGLVLTGDGPADGIELELWEMPYQGLGMLLPSVDPPLSLGTVLLRDGSSVVGFVANPANLTAEDDISHNGGWRSYLDGDA